MWGQDDFKISGNPNYSVCRQMLGFQNITDRIEGDILRHTNTDCSMVKLESSVSVNNNFHYDISSQLALKYQYLTKIFVVFKEWSNIVNISVNVGGTSFDFTQLQLETYNYYKKNIINTIDNKTYLEIPLPLLADQTVLPIFNNFSMTLSVEFSCLSQENPSVECLVVQTDTEEMRQLHALMNFNINIKNFYDYIPESIDLENDSEEDLSDYIDKYKKECDTFTTGKTNNFFRLIELMENVTVTSNEINVNSSKRPNKEIFICLDIHNNNSNDNVSIDVMQDCQNNKMKCATRIYTKNQMNMLQLSNYFKCNQSYSYVPFTISPNTTKHTGEITCNGITTYVSTVKQPRAVITCGNALVHIYYDLADGQIKCRIVKMCALYMYNIKKIEI